MSTMKKIAINLISSAVERLEQVREMLLEHPNVPTKSLAKINADVAKFGVPLEKFYELDYGRIPETWLKESEAAATPDRESVAPPEA